MSSLRWPPRRLAPASGPFRALQPRSVQQVRGQVSSSLVAGLANWRGPLFASVLRGHGQRFATYVLLAVGSWPSRCSCCTRGIHPTRSGVALHELRSSSATSPSIPRPRQEQCSFQGDLGYRQCGLTLPSNGLAPAAQAWPSFHSGPSPRRLREPLMSNVRRQESCPTNASINSPFPANGPSTCVLYIVARSGRWSAMRHKRLCVPN